ncbi:MAG: exodeoxyribonuclease VII small subunit [Alphaproteobacteria bacterium]|nr:exodeoxyribonuclease VII small subunit [Alphaproteobacteria bacterium]
MARKPAEAALEDIAGMSFEAALKELEDIVRRLEAGDVDLEGSISVYARGVALRRHCEARLKAAQERIEKISLGEDGQVRASPIDPA